MKFKDFMIVVLIVGGIMFGESLVKHQDDRTVDLEPYIRLTDEISANHAQINYKEVLAVTAVLEGNHVYETNEDVIKQTASLFMDQNLDEVIKTLSFNSRKKTLVYDYLNELEPVGLVPSRLVQTSSYMQFIEQLEQPAIQNYKQFGVLPSITIAQAILESGWGESMLAKEANNLFGIKAQAYYEGDIYESQTREFTDAMVTAKFRSYESMGDSIVDHAMFIYENPRYQKNGVFEANTYIYQAQALEKAGYSTDQNEEGEKIYAEKLIALIQQYNLQLIDWQAQQEMTIFCESER